MTNNGTMEFNQVFNTITAMNGELAEAVYMNDIERRVLVGAVLLNAHVLFEGNPGVGKTLTAKSLAIITGGSFGRIQGTPDLMPSDVTGSEVFNQGDSSFEFRKGPIHSNVLLADEVNRAMPKAQSALLEGMQEKQVTVAGRTYELPNPFLVLATQNAYEIGEGTNPLTIANQDRFSISIGMPDLERDGWFDIRGREDEDGELYVPRQVINPEDVALPAIRLAIIRGVSAKVPEVYDRTASIIETLRDTSVVDRKGSALAGDRAFKQMLLHAKAAAATEGRKVVEVKDINSVAPFVLRHRIALTWEGLNENVTTDEVMADVLRKAS